VLEGISGLPVSLVFGESCQERELLGDGVELPFAVAHAARSIAVRAHKILFGLRVSDI
jgi:hypothetical protein